MAGINFKAFDLGGHEIARKVWKDYYAKVCCREGMFAVLKIEHVLEHSNYMQLMLCTQHPNARLFIPHQSHPRWMLLCS